MTFSNIRDKKWIQVIKMNRNNIKLNSIIYIINRFLKLIIININN